MSMFDHITSELGVLYGYALGIVLGFMIVIFLGRKSHESKNRPKASDADRLLHPAAPYRSGYVRAHDDLLRKQGR